jgi:hypothetical protein
VVGGVSGAGVCDDTPPAKQSNMSAELLSRSTRLLRIDMTTPPHPRTSTHRSVTSRVQHRRSFAGARLADNSAMSGDRRCACSEEGGLGCRQIEFNGGCEPQAAEHARQRQSWRLGRYQCAGEMDQSANRAAVVRDVFTTGRTGRRIDFVTRLRAGERGRAC